MQRTLTLCASQKTLTMAVPVINILCQSTPALGIPGLAVIPIVFVHMAQTFVDSLLVALWLRMDRRLDAAVC